MAKVIIEFNTQDFSEVIGAYAVVSALVAEHRRRTEKLKEKEVDKSIGSVSPIGGRKMPKYKSYKEVWAYKIRSLTRNDDFTGTITPDEEGYLPFNVSAEYMEKHNPQTGGYYVVYKDGYESFSPSKAFEEGYVFIAE